MRSSSDLYDFLDRFLVGRVILRGFAFVALIWLAVTGQFFDAPRDDR